MKSFFRLPKFQNKCSFRDHLKVEICDLNSLQLEYLKGRITYVNHWDVMSI